MSHDKPRLTRREFLQRTGAAAGAAAIAFPHIASRAAEIGSGIRSGVRVGVIGTGGRGSSLMNSVADNVVAVCDVDSTHLGRAAASIEKRTERKPQQFTDY